MKQKYHINFLCIHAATTCYLYEEQNNLTKNADNKCNVMKKAMKTETGKKEVKPFCISSQLPSSKFQVKVQHFET